MVFGLIESYNLDYFNDTFNREQKKNHREKKKETFFNDVQGNRRKYLLKNITLWVYFSLNLLY